MNLLPCDVKTYREYYVSIIFSVWKIIKENGVKNNPYLVPARCSAPGRRSQEATMAACAPKLASAASAESARRASVKRISEKIEYEKRAMRYASS